MIKMERTYGCLRASVLFEGEKIGTMEGVYLTQWFVKNKYRFTGTFNRYLTEYDEFCRPGARVDVVLPDKELIVKNVFIEWIREPSCSGTFNAERIESYI
ncbi:MAG TPA: hypothetical protein VLR54_01315 [Methanobacteriaceae archaeon]|jgi:hypothetical protein|nr:hypothetical protein [Methanobacteriaceae archaeon]